MRVESAQRLFRSVLSGGSPTGHAFPDWEAAREGLATLITRWDEDPETAVPHERIAVCVPTNRMATELTCMLKPRGIDAVEIRSDGPDGSTGVHIGTMFRFKGLAYLRMIIAGGDRRARSA
ncbi:hypothetical protein [Streptomyces sp. HSG2]|uniref:hypothetical protein n=1 Tax=Streptomyces sp. HSG2 TaxID=2797167 RepID=UPI001908F35A|nr:hypothetical protein [Streptomyces sp. HSG2]